ncbi:MAG: class I SAM-dependent methyltransferase [Candidatus Aminicenantes bacterium]|nr:MAG: class I SAM-dependent methyltransferase [Candidatus Aminicenantes bacterium]
MQHQYSNNIWRILACPYCGHPVEKIDLGAICHYCHEKYVYTDSGALDLRLKKPKTYHLEFELGTSLLSKSEFDFNKLSKNITPEVNFSGTRVPFHLTKELLSYFPRAKGKNSLMLDLGCGDTVHREVCELAGFEYVGLDYNSPRAPMLGDAHSLPFKDSSFEFILTIAVLEHIRFPFVMMREAYRVLKADGRFIGTVAFLEPFHSDSYYHHTHLGTFNSLKYGGFQVERIAPNKSWSVFMAQSRMDIFPRMPRFLCKSLVLPLSLLQKLWWQAGGLIPRSETKSDRIRNTTGAFTFIATKE